MLKRFFLFTSSFLLFFSQSFAQLGLNLQFLPNQGSAQYIQPAYIADQSFKYVQLHGEGAGFLTNNQLTANTIFSEGNEITESAKDQILEQIGGASLYGQAGYSWGLHANIKAFKLNWLLSFRQQDGVYAGNVDSSSVGLLLRGNAPYAGQRVLDEGIFTNRVKYEEYAIATAFSIKKVNIGVRAKYVRGLRANLIEDVAYNLLTSDDGTSIDVQSKYDIREVLSGDPNGWGLGLDLGLTYDLNEKIKLQGSLLDIGFINWEGREIKGEVDFRYEGTEVGGVGGNDLSDGELFSIDTLQQLMFPDTVDANFNSNLGTRFQVGMSYQLCERSMLHASIHQNIAQQAPATQIPLVNVAYHYELNRFLMLGANVFGGGLERYGLGGVFSTNFPIGKEANISIYGAADNFIGMVIPSASRGANVNLGMSIGW